MYMIGNAPYHERCHSVLTRNAAQVGVKTFADFLPNPRPRLAGVLNTM